MLVRRIPFTCQKHSPEGIFTELRKKGSPWEDELGFKKLGFD